MMGADADVVRAHHDRTVHRPGALSSARAPLDWSNRPRSDKCYRGIAPVALPTELPESDAPAGVVLAGEAPTGTGPLDLAGLARLLFYANGVVRRRRLNGLTVHFRAAPSAGALYPVEVYVVCGDLPDLSAGVYHFDPLTFSLQPLRTGDWRGQVAISAADADAGAAPATVVLTGVPWRTVWKYGERGYRHLFWDAGAVAANLLATAAAAGLATRLLSGFVDAEIADLVSIAEGQAPAQGGEVPLALLPVGAAGDQPPPPPAVEPLELDVEPLSRETIDEPRLWHAHRAGDLAAPAHVSTWRAGLGRADHAAAASPSSGPADGEHLEAVVLRRGSTRRFSRAPAAQTALAWPLDVAARHVPGDLAPAGRTHLLRLVNVHDVEEVARGAYRHANGELEQLHRDVSREQTRDLCLGQPLGGDAAYTTFLAADLSSLLDVGGARAYRVAQLEAGVAAERLQLAAFTIGLGASGLTFFDEEVRAAFRTERWPMLTVGVGVPAYQSRPGRRPGEP